MDSTATPAPTPADAGGPVDPPPPTLVQKLAAEAIGTAVLVLSGCGAVMALSVLAISQGGEASDAGVLDYTTIGLAFGLAIVVMVYAFGRISGGHFNPAVSVGAALSGRISWKDAGLYSAAQVGGAIIGAALLALFLLVGDTAYSWELGDPLGANGYGDQGGINLIGALLLELVLTFVFLTVILAVTDERNEHPGLAPLAIGLTLAAIHFVGVSFTGTSVNPARSIGPGLFSGTDYAAQLWLFILAPVLGAALAGLAYPALFGRATEPVAGSGFRFGPRPARGAYGAPDQFQQQWNQPAGGYDATHPQTGGYAATGQQGQQGYGAYGATSGQHGAVQGSHAGHAGQGSHASQGSHAAQQTTEQPIIQDGWQWDPQAQQWIPAQQPYQQQAQGQQSQAQAQTHAQGQSEAQAHPQQTTEGDQRGWAAPGSTDQTQVRPGEPT